MLCGELARPLPLLSLRLLPPPWGAASGSPYCNLVALVEGMAALAAAAPGSNMQEGTTTTTPSSLVFSSDCHPSSMEEEEEEEDVLLENGLLSYENPNYHLDPARLDDALNSNTDTAERLYEELCHELDAVCLAGGGGGGGGGGKATRGRNPNGSEDTGAIGRRGYAALDIGSMGVDVTSGPVTGPQKRKQQQMGMTKQACAAREVLMDQAEDGEEREEDGGDGAQGDSDSNENNRGNLSQCQHRKQLHMSCPQSMTYDTSSTTISSTSPTTCIPSAPPLDNSPLGCIATDNGNKGNCIVNDKTDTNMGRRPVDTFAQGGNLTQQLRQEEQKQQHHRRQHKNGSQKSVRSSIQQPDLIQHAVESQHQHQQNPLICPQTCNVKTEDMMDVNSPDAADNQVQRGLRMGVDHMVGLEPGGVPHIQGHLNSDLYAVPVKRTNEISHRDVAKKQAERSSSEDKEEDDEDEDSEEDEDDSEDDERQEGEAGSNAVREMLPPGWERHEDSDGPYYWHIKSGTIQREPPTTANNVKSEIRQRSLAKEAESALSNFQPPLFNTVTRSSTSSALEDLDGKRREDRREEMAYKRRSFPARSEPEPMCLGGSSSSNSIAARERPIRFAVRSLGWVEIAEEDLTPERSSKAVNKCIVDLSLGRNDLLDVVGRWGDGKDLFMDLDEGALKLIDPENLTVLNTQPIHTIRVWGVGRDNGRERDFAYVARDRMTRKHMCHVFRCDIPARTIANTLRDICKKIMIERSLQQSLAKPIDIGGTGISGRSSLATRPTNLPTEHRRFHHRNGQTLVTAQSFPTPMEEPKKVLRAQYLGQTQVSSATGMDVLNDAIDLMKEALPSPDLWRHVNVAVAPSMISILDPSDDNKLLAECRVRYLSFLGIGRNVKQCGFIMHTAQDLFIAHIFHCEPSSGALCKTVEAACKLRYQKCLDAHPQNGLSNWSSCHGNSTASSLSNGSAVHGGSGGQSGQSGGSGTKGITATLKLLVGSLTGNRRGGNGNGNNGRGGNRSGRCVSAVGVGASHNIDS